MEKDVNENVCVFKDVLECSNTNEYSSVEMSQLRIQKAIESSLRRNDELYTSLQSMENIKYHKNCYISYTSNDHIDRYPKRKTQQEASSSSSANKRSRRSLSTTFEFKRNCLVCGEICNVIPDKKHPDRWMKNKGFLCRTADRGKGKMSFKEVLLQVHF